VKINDFKIDVKVDKVDKGVSKDVSKDIKVDFKVDSSKVESFKGDDFKGVDFKGVDFKGDDFKGVDFKGEEFKGGDFKGEEFKGEEFKGDDFKGVDFKDDDFKGGDFKGGDFKGDDFKGEEFMESVVDARIRENNLQVLRQREEKLNLKRNSQHKIPPYVVSKKTNSPPYVSKIQHKFDHPFQDYSQIPQQAKRLIHEQHKTDKIRQREENRKAKETGGYRNKAPKIQTNQEQGVSRQEKTHFVRHSKRNQRQTL